MRLFAIGDLHLSGHPPKKPMEIFGPRWKDHWSRIQEDWNSRVTADDTVLIAGDTSWAMHLKDAQEDLDEIRAYRDGSSSSAATTTSGGKALASSTAWMLKTTCSTSTARQSPLTKAHRRLRHPRLGLPRRHPLQGRTGRQALPPRAPARRAHPAGSGKARLQAHHPAPPLPAGLRPDQAQRLYGAPGKIQGTPVHLRPSPRHAAQYDVPPPLQRHPAPPCIGRLSGLQAPGNHL